MIVMVLVSLGGTEGKSESLCLDKSMFRVSPSTLILILLTLMILMALYVKFW